MNYKDNLIKTHNVKKFMKINLEDIKSNVTISKKNKYNNMFDIAINQIDTYDIVGKFMDIKDELSEYGFMDNFNCSDFFNVIRSNFIDFDSNEENSIDESDDIHYDIMPFEDKYLYEI